MFKNILHRASLVAGIWAALAIIGILQAEQYSILVNSVAAQQSNVEQEWIRYDSRKPGRHGLGFTYTAGKADFNLAGEKTIIEEYRIGNFHCGDRQIELVDDRIGDGFIKTVTLGSLKIVDKINYVELWITEEQDGMLDEVCARD